VVASQRSFESSLKRPVHPLACDRSCPHNPSLHLMSLPHSSRRLGQLPQALKGPNAIGKPITLGSSCGSSGELASCLRALACAKTFDARQDAPMDWRRRQNPLAASVGLACWPQTLEGRREGREGSLIALTRSLACRLTDGLTVGR